ncbi:hypothetical protein [Cupriavidus malaysiensis]|uniref:Uncharacterized protein n=1 Tax=Cupriavidus malaysiensis TaxID=367825 RepID=A0A1D9IEI3_9BURK|nr:hypothetical protein [Cupriavidus malaysiensis]AOZ10514.1 hypothetical protein BKK80_33670 [Cupriavidus malaysiensis]
MSIAHHAKPTPTAVLAMLRRGETDFPAGRQPPRLPARRAGPPLALSHARWMKYGPWTPFLILSSAAGMPASRIDSGTLSMAALATLAALAAPAALAALATLPAAPWPGCRAGRLRGRRA